MDLHRVRRLATVLIASQLRSGRADSNPKSLFGQPVFIALVDVGLFLVAAAAGFAAVSAVRSPSAPPSSGTLLAAVANSVLPFLPLVGVGVVLVAGMMFELTTTTRFALSDAANWLPLGPAEYVAASTAAIAYTYSPAVALALGALFPVAVSVGQTPEFLLAAALSLLALVEGGFLIEMVRSVSQRAGTLAVGRGGRATVVVRAVLLLVVILALQLAFNPVLLYGFVERLRSAALVIAIVPFLWGTQALLELQAGQPAVAAGFALAEAGFAVLLLAIAARLRVRYWVPTSAEIRISSGDIARGHPWLAALGLNAPEAAVVSKDLRGLVRRREMLPALVVPFVLVVLLLVEGRSIGSFALVIWLGWVAGFFSLFLGAISVGQERRALQFLLATPIGPTGLFRAKVAALLIPTALTATVMAVAVGLYFGLGVEVLLGLVLLSLACAALLGLWGLAFAARFSDFQDRPRPQFLRPSAMLAATGSGMAILFSVVVPGAFALMGGGATLPALLVAALVALVFGGLAVFWARSGFVRLFRELPF